jgi:putative DNA primase/helicase
MNACEEFCAAIRAAGLTPPDEIIPDGTLRRFPTNGKRGDDAGYYVLHQDGIPAGMFGDFRSGIQQTWRADVGRKLSFAEADALKRKRDKARQECEAEQARERAEAAGKAKALWKRAQPAGANHPYLSRKGVGPVATLREIPTDTAIAILGYAPKARGEQLRGQLLVAPIKVWGQWSSAELIDEEGRKSAISGGAKSAGYWSTGALPESDGAGVTLAVVEGVATALTVAQASGSVTLAALSSGNLEGVAHGMRERYPAARIIIGADLGSGQDKAEQAARGAGALLALPDFGADRPASATDFNDLAQHRGPEAVRQAIANARKPEDQARQHGVSSVTEVDSWPLLCALDLDDVPREYPLAALPAAIRSAVEEVVAFVQCPAALAACSALSAVSAAAQALADVERDARLSGPSSLYFLAVAESGERKTECDKHFLAAIRSWQLEQSDLFRLELAKHAAEFDAWEARRGGIKERIRKRAKDKKPTDEDKEELAALEDAKPQPIRVPRLLHADTTPEALAANLANGWPSGAVVSSEAGTVFGGHGMQRDSIMRNLALLNSMWDGIQQDVDRRGAGHFLVAGVRLSMGLASQPDTVRAFIDASKGLARGSGFAARFLIARPGSTQGQRLYRPAGSWTHVEQFGARLLELLHIEPTRTLQGTLAPAALRFTPTAQKAWIAFYDDVERELRPGGDMTEIRDVASKAADNTARLACLFHVFQHGASGTIDEECVRSAAQVVGWHLYEARRFLGDVAAPLELADARKLDAWLIDRSRRNAVSDFTLREVQQKGPYSIRKKPALDAAIVELAEAGRARLTLDGKRIMVRPELLRDGNGAA